MSVARCQQEIDAVEFRQWQAMYQLEPWGPERDDRRAAVLGWLITAASSTIKPIEPSTIMEILNPQPKAPLTPEKHKEKARQLSTYFQMMAQGKKGK